MSRNVTRMVTVAAMMLLVMQASAEDLRSATTPQQAVVVVQAGSSLLPKRWCVEAHMITPSLATRSSLHEPTDVAWPGAALSVYDFQLVDGVADRATLSYRLAEVENDRLLTFWKSDSLGVFLGISDGGFLSLSIGP
jgi:hypothetical protein